MALSKLKYNSLNVTAAANKGIGFDSDPDALQADYTGGSIIFIKKITASSDSTISFVDGTSDVVLDNTYKEYLFTFNNIHPATNSQKLQVGFRDGSTDYDAVKTTTYFGAYHYESDSDAALGYFGSNDLAQSTAFQPLSSSVGNDNDQCCSGYLRLFNPSSTTFVKHFISQVSDSSHDDANDHTFVAGYCNTTTAIDAVQFKYASGNIDSGDICLYGIN